MLHSQKIAYKFFIAIFYLFLFQSFLQNQWRIFGYFDEILAACGLALGLMRLMKYPKVRKYSWGWPLALAMICGFMGNIAYQYQPSVIQELLAAYSNLKFWLMLVLGYTLFRQLNIARNAQRIYFHVKIIIVLYMFLVLLDNVFGLFDSPIRYGFRSSVLFYEAPTAFAAYCAFLFVILLALKEYLAISLWWMIAVLFLICSTLRSKSLAAACVFCLIYYFAYIRKKKITLKTLLLFVPVGLLIAWNQISYYFFSDIQSDSARYQLLITSIKIMKDHFPIGSGFGTFASYFSGVSYSGIYDLYGISNVNGLRPGATSFIADSFWPMVMGEFGAIGTIFFMVALWLLFKQIQKLRAVSIPFYTSALAILFYILISSMAESAFVNPVMMPLGMMLGILLYSNQKPKIMQGERK